VSATIELKRFSPFAELAEADAELVEDLIEVRELETEETVVNEGDEADGLILVGAGQLRLVSERVPELPNLEPGRYMGGLSLGSLGRREVSLIAAEPSVVFLFTRSAFLRLSEDAPRAATRVLESVLRDLGASLRAGIDDLA